MHFHEKFCILWHRHAKKVNEQNTREKILSADKSTVATVSVSPLVATTSKQSRFFHLFLAMKMAMDLTSSQKLLHFSGIKVDEMDILDAESTKKPPRRVLPEHEGRYKITLPSGTTERSQQILAKKTTSKPNSKDIIAHDRDVFL